MLLEIPSGYKGWYIENTPGVFEKLLAMGYEPMGAGTKKHGIYVIGVLSSPHIIMGIGTSHMLRGLKHLVFKSEKQVLLGRMKEFK